MQKERDSRTLEQTPEQTLETGIDGEQDSDFVSKTAVKKALQELLLFGESLLELNPQKLGQLPLSDLLLSELALAKRLKVDNSRRRQMQRIAKIIRSENTEEILEAYQQLQDKNRQHQQSIQPAEQWCERLLEEADALSEFINRYPDSNRQQLGQLIRNTKKEKTAGKPATKNQQRLYKLIQETLLNHE